MFEIKMFRLQTISPQRVDPVVPHTELVRFDAEVGVEGGGELSYASLSVRGECHDVRGLDKPSGVLRVWVLLLEGLCGATPASCPHNQPHVLDTLFNLFRDLLLHPGWILTCNLIINSNTNSYNN